MRRCNFHDVWLIWRLLHLNACDEIAKRAVDVLAAALHRRIVGRIHRVHHLKIFILQALSDRHSLSEKILGHFFVNLSLPIPRVLRKAKLLNFLFWYCFNNHKSVSLLNLEFHNTCLYSKMNVHYIAVNSCTGHKSQNVFTRFAAEGCP